MSRLITPPAPSSAGDVPSLPLLLGAPDVEPAAASSRALQRQVGELQDEVDDLRRRVSGLESQVRDLRIQHGRDVATARGLGEALGAIRRGALALRSENEELRRQVSARRSRHYGR